MSTNSVVAVGLHHFIDHRGRAGDQLQVVFALQALLHDVHVQQPQKAAAKPEAQRSGYLRFVMQGRIIQAQFGQRIAEALVVLGIDRKHTREDTRLHLFETRAAVWRCRGLRW